MGDYIAPYARIQKKIDKPQIWTNIGVESLNSDITKARKKLNDKMMKHFNSLFHQDEVKNQMLAKKSILPEIVSNNIDKKCNFDWKTFQGSLLY